MSVNTEMNGYEKTNYFVNFYSNVHASLQITLF